MSSETSHPDPELEPKPVDCIVVLGRGIEQVDGRGWRPTTSIERLSEQGWHPGTREKGLTPDSEGEIILAGSNANIYAAVELFEEQSAAGAAPSLVIFAAGRPNYLMDNPDPTLSEGSVMSAKFQDRTRKTAAAETMILDQNRNTQDDIIESLKVALERGFKEVKLITIGAHVPRATEFLKLAYAEHPEFAGISANFVASEDLLERRYAGSATAFSLYSKGVEALRDSQADLYTRYRERRGINALRRGNY